MSGLLLRLYPKSWRERYGDEFEAVLDERPLGPFDVLDILLAAVDARLHLRGLATSDDHGREFMMPLRLGGYAALVGGLLWIVGFMIQQFDGSGDIGVGQWLVLAGTLALLLALTGLSAAASRRHPWLTWAAFAVPAFGALLSGIGLLSMALGVARPIVGDAWTMWAGGTMLLVAGSGLFALAAWRSGPVSAVGVALLAAAMIAILPVIAISSGVVSVPWEPLVSIALLVLLFGFALGWVLVGIDAVRRDRRAVGQPASGTVV